MNELPKQIFQKWGHSFEEDKDSILVYRPEDYKFPLARGRDGMEFKQDGTFIDWRIGRGDASRGVNGHWQVEDSGLMRISFDMNLNPPQKLEIVRCNEKVLMVRKQSNP